VKIINRGFIGIESVKKNRKMPTPTQEIYQLNPLF
jgi:hypothetical protein